MLDRESTFADAEIIQMLQEDFIPVAIDQAYQRRQQDTEGEFYRKIAGAGPRSNFQQTTQGLYLAHPDGTFLGFNNNRGPDRVKRMMRNALNSFEATEVDGIEPEDVDERYSPSPPENGLVVRVSAKVLDGYEPSSDHWRTIFQQAVSRDNLWISAAEHRQLASGVVSPALQERIARFHFVDNTRGEPPMWRENEIRSIDLKIENGQVTGAFHLETADGSRGFQGELLGVIEVDGDNVTRLDLVAKGTFWGEGRYTRGAPKEPFPLAIALTIADGTDVADGIPPQGSRGWVRGYLSSE